MDTVFAVVSVLALLIAWGARKRALSVEDRLSEARRAGMSAQTDVEELTKTVKTLQSLVGRMAGGHEVDALMVREGRLYKNTTTTAVQKAVEDGQAPYVIDVRTDKEWATGHIPGAVHIPVDSLEKHLHSVKRDGTPIHVICAGGGRSAAAAGFLAERGYPTVFNIEGGMNSWRGPVTKD